jgi:D-glycero-D-manno-heptose 1,7-bisphosphate phosphatase
VTVVFLDRDGVINDNGADYYVKDWERFIFLSGAKEAVRRLAESDDVKIFIVSNQAGVGKGEVSAERVEEINRRMKEELEAAGGRIDGVFYCPHTADDRCSCRKPEIGLLTRALQQCGVKPDRCFMVGDALSDVEAGKKASAVAIMVKTGRGEAQLKLLNSGASKPDHVAEDISEAVEFILSFAPPV